MAVPQVYPLMLWLLAFLFSLRVFGQMLVAYSPIPYLPPMEEWYSGLIPYPILLPIQLAIIVLLLKVCLDFSRGDGFFIRLTSLTGRRLCWFSYAYAGSMVVRYIATMALYPERRWLGGVIPIIFHFVLAGYVYTLGYFHSRRTAAT